MELVRIAYKCKCATRCKKMLHLGIQSKDLPSQLFNFFCMLLSLPLFIFPPSLPRPFSHLPAGQLNS